MKVKDVWFPFSVNWYTAISFFSNEDKGIFLSAIVQYRYSGQKAIVPPHLVQVYDEACVEIDADKEYAAELSEKRKAAINKRWNKPKNDTIVLQEYYNSNSNVLQMNYNSNTNTIQDKTIQDNTVNKTRKPKRRSSVVYDNAYRWEEFWNAYPRKAGKESVYSLWTSLQPTDAMVDAILYDIKTRKHSRQWTDDGGRYIQNPINYLKDEKWKEKPVESSTDRFTRLINEINEGEDYPF